MQILGASILLFSLIVLINPAKCFDEEDPDSSEHGVTATRYRTNCTCGTANKKVTMVVKGKKTKPHEYPLIAGLVFYEDDLIICGGAILTEKHIVTAGHCLAPYQPQYIGVHVGHHNYNEVKKFSPLYEPRRFFVHPRYQFLKLKYDIGIILLKKPIIFNKNIGPACLPKERIPLQSQVVKVLGWGHTEFLGSVSEYLLKVNLHVKPLDFCRYANPDLELEDVHQICTYRPPMDSCNGDSGGPVLWLDKITNRYTLVGLISYGYDCAVNPAVNTDVYYFLPWIQSVISNTSRKLRTCARL